MKSLTLSGYEEPQVTRTQLDGILGKHFQICATLLFFLFLNGAFQNNLVAEEIIIISEKLPDYGE